MTTAVVKKTRGEICYEAVKAYQEENPGTSLSAAFRALVEPLGPTSVGAISQAYHGHVTKIEGPRRPRKRNVAKKVTMTPAGSLLQQIEALMKRLENLDAREADLDAREQKLAAFEAALRAAQA